MTLSEIQCSSLAYNNQKVSKKGEEIFWALEYVSLEEIDTHISKSPSFFNIKRTR